MGTPKVFNWPAPSTTAVALGQTLGEAGVLILNGSLVNTAEPVPQAVFAGISRSVSLTSTANLTARTFSIYGTYNGRIISEDIAGPNNNTVQTNSFFDTVTSVSVDGAVATNVSVGTGTTGHTHWFKYNYNASVYGFGVQVVVANTINYTFQSTLDDVQVVSTPTAFATINTMSAATTSQIGGNATLSLVNGAGNYQAFVPIPFNYCRVLINSSTNGSLIATYIQQGIS